MHNKRNVNQAITILCDIKYIATIVYSVCWFSNGNPFNVNNIFIIGKTLHHKNVDPKTA